MTDIVIPIGRYAVNKNQELKYCLRSLEKHLTGVGKVFIIGECPDWVTGVVHIPFEEDPRNRFRDRNIMLKMTEACKNSRVSDNFLMVHDDHFLLTDYDAGDFPYYHMGLMNEGHGQYGQTKINTKSLFCHDPYEVINNYDCHCPIVFHKERFKKVLQADWTRWYGYCLKTLYCVMNGIEGLYMDDIKIRMPLQANEIMEQLSGRSWFSIGDRCFTKGGMWDVLESLYPFKSRYEQ